MTPDKLLEAIKACADKAAEKGVEVKVEIDAMSANGSIVATITATSVKTSKTLTRCVRCGYTPSSPALTR